MNITTPIFASQAHEATAALITALLESLGANCNRLNRSLGLFSEGLVVYHLVLVILSRKLHKFVCHYFAMPLSHRELFPVLTSLNNLRLSNHLQSEDMVTDKPDQEVCGCTFVAGIANA